MSLANTTRAFAFWEGRMRQRPGKQNVDDESINEHGVEKWCHYAGTIQDSPDVCLVTAGVYPPESVSSDNSPDDTLEDNSYKYYGWYKITYTANGSDTGKSVYRRLRKAATSEGYPNNCIVMDPYTTDELGIEVFNVYRESDDDRRASLTHYRSKKLNLAETVFPHDNCCGIERFIAGKPGVRERKST